MTKQLAHLVLIISLVGQFLLTPAMAMPSFLHAFTHAEMTHDDSSELMPVIQQSPTLTSSMMQSSIVDATTFSNEAGIMKHGEQDCDMMVSNMSSNDSDILIDCDALCEMIAAGDCVSHCASTTGILIQAQFTLTTPESSAPVQTLSWSTQTAELASVNPPPIWTRLT
ncbi:hypothetical protein FM038_001165 [Shewanella eurypsychrophilus]|uniref:Uncharacterized protein n=1 Tax=Shewanella eurypsychrophilus TaxID=2593656 RepID=A0ABX6V0S6_9GAMM|nr:MULTISPECIES: hypothetical protein [Shewanella]QFU20620.1 hypothetical protein FS418_01150 [Shewanella sp. YLB-09]QFU20901.1 hypothetical protein FS418_02760 [Shewanella sp. YLB-09]QPG56189.1 hypothetical protein FM038_001165 [Shewanella eurypsychrophilus]